MNVTAQTNNGRARTTSITISGGGVTKTVSISQKGVQILLTVKVAAVFADYANVKINNETPGKTVTKVCDVGERCDVTCILLSPEIEFVDWQTDDGTVFDVNNPTNIGLLHGVILIAHLQWKMKNTD